MARPSDRGPSADRLRIDLHRAVMGELSRRSLDNATALAAALGIAEITAAGILRREPMEIGTALWIADAVGLAVHVKVEEEKAS